MSRPLRTGCWTFLLIAISAISDAAESQSDAATLPDLRLDGSQITDETLSSLEGHDWGEITLTNVRNSAHAVEQLRHARSIRSLRMLGSDISGQIPRLSNVVGLRELEISGALNGNDLEAIGRLTELEKLSLPSGFTNALTINVVGAREVAQLIQLKSLNLYCVNIDDDAFKEFKTLTRLEELDLSHTRVSDDGLKAIEQMPHLKRLDLSKFPSIKQRFTSASIPIIAKMAELETLSLSGQIGDQDLAKIVELPKLKSLNIYWTELSVNDLDELSNSKIEHLILSAHQIGVPGFDGRGVQALKKCKHLKHLWVNGKFWNEQHFHWLTKELPGVGLGFNS